MTSVARPARSLLRCPRATATKVVEVEVLPASAVSYFDQFRVESPHNQVLAIASGAGIPAAIDYLVLVGGIICFLWRGARRNSDPTNGLALVAAIAASAGHVVSDSFMSAEVTGSWLLWTLVGAALAISFASTERREPIAV